MDTTNRQGTGELGKIIPDWYRDRVKSEWDYSVLLTKEVLVRAAITLEMPELYEIAKTLK
jgi:hypothetical protein